VKVPRNSPCPCGSQIKAKRCCLAEPHRRITTPRATLARLQSDVVGDLIGIDRDRLYSLYDEMIHLPELDMSLHMRLPGLRTPEVIRAADAISAGDGDRFDRALRDARAAVDTIERRLQLAQAVMAMRESGRVSRPLAASAIIDLNQPGSALATSALAQAIAVAAGDERTPAGLLVAS